MGQLILESEHSLIDQSLDSKEGATTTNGDGFGVGWYGELPEPGIYKSIGPAWSDRNLEELSKHIRSHLFLAHVRATTGTPIQQTNCHPFSNGNWMLVHNGVIHGFEKIKRELVFNIDPSLFYAIEGTTDSEIIFYLALTFGLKDDPFKALEQTVGFIEHVGRKNNVANPAQMTLGMSDGKRLFAVRYSTEHQSRSLYHSGDMEALKQINPELKDYSRDARAIVSEPLSDMVGAWIPIPESTAVVIENGVVEKHPFKPKY